jgi:hypothetical protein
MGYCTPKKTDFSVREMENVQISCENGKYLIITPHHMLVRHSTYLKNLLASSKLPADQLQLEFSNFQKDAIQTFLALNSDNVAIEELRMSQTCRMIQFLSDGYQGCEWHQTMIHGLCRHAYKIAEETSCAERVKLATELANLRVGPIPALVQFLTDGVPQTELKATHKPFLANNSVDQQSVQMCVKVLEHASSCRDQHCAAIACQKMKKIIAHSDNCARKSHGCQQCKRLVTLCVFHAKECNKNRCSVPHCMQVKQRMKRRQNKP